MSDVYQLVAPVVRAEGSELTPVSVQLAFNQLALSVKNIVNTIAQGNPPNGPAGGDLSGTYPNPTVAAVHATSGTIDGVVIGGVTPAAGTFSTLTLSAALAIAQGGTGATTQSGALSNILGASAVPIANGGTAATTASGARTNLGLGTIATQNANAVAITGGTIEGTAIGGVTPAAGAFTTLTASTPVGVASGGTGRSSLTIHGVLIGETTGAVNQTAAGTTGQMLLGVTGADPAFGNNPVIASGTIDGAVIGGTTKAAGSFTTIVATGSITPASTSGIVGTTTNDNANAGSVGEFITATGTGVSLTNATPANVTSIVITAGDWDVFAGYAFAGAGSEISTVQSCGISTTSATFGAAGTFSGIGASTVASGGFAGPTPTLRFTVAGNTTVYLVAQANFSPGTVTITGMLNARRVR